MEITTKHPHVLGEKVECHHRQRHIFLTGLRLRSRDWGGWLKSMGVPLHSTTPPLTHTCASSTSPNCSIQQNLICGLSPDDQTDCCSAATMPPGGYSDVWQAECKMEARHFLSTESWVRLHGPDRRFLIFSGCTDKWLIVSLDKRTVFRVMGIRGRCKWLKHWVRPSQ